MPYNRHDLFDCLISAVSLDQQTKDDYADGLRELYQKWDDFLPLYYRRFPFRRTFRAVTQVIQFDRIITLVREGPSAIAEDELEAVFINPSLLMYTYHELRNTQDRAPWWDEKK